MAGERTLTQSQIMKIKLAAGKCEIPSCPKGPYQVHHINGDRSDDSYSNLIVLCSNHHTEAEGKHVMGSTDRVADTSKTRLRRIVRDRRQYVITAIKSALSKKTTTKKSNDTDPYIGWKI
jgi:HNH endonuclease